MVLDASAVVEWLLGSERGNAVASALADDPDGVFLAPDLLDVEVVQVFRRLAHDGAVSESRATASVALLERLPVDRRPTLPLLPRVWALRDNLTAYDATYVALAEALACPLLTCDARIRDTPVHGALIRVVG